MIEIGVLSDTHGHLDPRIPKIFAKVDHILHAGDIGLPSLIHSLESIAPVTAVVGNTDYSLELRETEIVSLDRWKFLLHHIIDVRMPCQRLQSRIDLESPDVVVFGHTHRRYCERVGNTLFLNPGYAGIPRFNYERSVVILRCGKGGITPIFRKL